MGKTVVLGMGNEIRGDDALGLITARRLKKETLPAGVDVLECSGSGFDIIDLISVYEKIIIIDSIRVEAPVPGKIHRFTLDEYAADTGKKAVTLHQIGVFGALEIAKHLKIDIASEVIIYAVEAEHIDEFSDTLTKEIENAVFKLVDMLKHKFCAAERELRQ